MNKPKKTLLMTLDSPFLDNKDVFPYLGILYLLGVAKDEGKRIEYLNRSKVELSFINAIFPELNKDVYYSDEINKCDIFHLEGFDLVGISCMTPQGAEAYAVLKEFKRWHPKTTVMIGGPHATHYTDQCIEAGFDIVIKGDGERAFQEILQRGYPLLLKGNLTEKEMNEMPLPHREDRYIDRYKYILDGEPATTIVNSRGCPMGCAFCEDSRTGGRWYSPEHLERELIQITEMGINRVMFFDDLFAWNLKRFGPYAAFLETYRVSHDLRFRCCGHASTMTKPFAETLKHAGCIEIGFGAESADQRILDTVGKGTRVYQLHRFIETTIEAGLKVKGFFMLGLPGEDAESVKKTKAFIMKYREKYPDKFDFDLVVYFPYRGTVIGDAIRKYEGGFHVGANIHWEHLKKYKRSFNLRLIDGLTWNDVDSGHYGAYKKTMGASDIVTESYDWDKGKVLLSANEMLEIKDEMLRKSARYADGSPFEGNIGMKDKI